MNGGHASLSDGGASPWRALAPALHPQEVAHLEALGRAMGFQPDRAPRATADPSAPPLEMRASVAMEDALVRPPVTAAEAANADDAAVAPGPEATAPDVKVDTQPEMPTRGDGAAQSTAETTAVAPEPPQVTTSAVLTALDAMLREIEDRLPDFSLLSAERQRLERWYYACSSARREQRPSRGRGASSRSRPRTATKRTWVRG